MDTQNLRALLSQPEGPGLEFKEEFYAINCSNPERKRRERGEMVKDILSLANGNTSVAGERAYLIFGADDVLDEDGRRVLHGVGDMEVSAPQILQIVNSSCSPPLEDVKIEDVTVDGKRLLVITIFPTPHLHETMDKLETPSRPYTEHVVFVRQGESVRVASDKEREAIRQLKRVRYNEANNVSPMAFGAVVGALSIGLIAADQFERTIKHRHSRKIGAVIGGAIGVFFGGSVGYALKSMRMIKREWETLPEKNRPLFAAFMTLWGILIAVVAQVVVGRRRAQK